MINGLRAQIVNHMSGSETITRRSGLNWMMFLGGNFFRLAKLGQVGPYQCLSGRRHGVSSADMILAIRMRKKIFAAKTKNPPRRV
nr:hypothetical protein [Citrobacter amalonaticus]